MVEGPMLLGRGRSTRASPLGSVFVDAGRRSTDPAVAGRCRRLPERRRAVARCPGVLEPRRSTPVTPQGVAGRGRTRGRRRWLDAATRRPFVRRAGRRGRPRQRRHAGPGGRGGGRRRGRGLPAARSTPSTPRWCGPRPAPCSTSPVRDRRPTPPTRCSTAGQASGYRLAAAVVDGGRAPTTRST